MRTKRIMYFLAGFLLVFVSACGSQTISASGPTTEIYATALSVGGAHSCVLLNNGHVLCWGDNSARQLGDGTSIMRTSAVEVLGLQDVVSVSAGGEFTCAALRDGTVQCWGGNKSGQLGIGNNDLSTTPTVVPGLTNVIAISAGDEHACALLDTGKVKCWGKNLNSRVGDGSATRLIPSPVDVVGLDNVISIFAGGEHTCALTKDGKAKCWGKNVDGELGNGQDNNLSKKPTEVVGLDGTVVSLAMGYRKTCVVTNAGTPMCSGWVGFQQFTSVPVAPAQLNGKAKLIAAGGNHICVVLEVGSVQCWGENKNGQLGNGSTQDSQKFVEVKGLQNSVTAIGAYFDYTCILTAAGEVFCWGSNSAGQLGNGTTTNSSKPVKVIGVAQ